MRIAVGEGKFARIEITEDEISFEEFAKQCSEPLKGGKWGWYFLRGYDLNESTGHEHKYHRCDEILNSSEFLIIDADSSSANKDSAPSPEAGHEALKKLGYSHFIYTSHSHSKEKNKWRAVLPCKIAEETTEKNKEKLKATYFQLIADLQKTGLDIAPTTESYVWSQPWYMPSREDPTDGLFEFFSWFKGKTPSVSSVVKPTAEKPTAITATTDEETVEGIIFGLMSGAHCHTAVRKLLYMKAKDGVTKEAACAEVSALMQINKTHKDWEIVYAGIEKSFEDAAINVSEVTNDITAVEISIFSNRTKLKKPLTEEML
ncbi:hypothetical protein KA005_16180, partial [bacterium]|nr:hypothetical protein [bacterium]